MIASDGAEERRPYDSPVRRARAAETRERILAAAGELVRELQSWDWRPLTFRAVAERAGVGQRTVYRHFATEQALHEAVMLRLETESGVSYRDLSLDDVSEVGARVFASMATFRAPAWAEVTDEVLLAADDQRQQALRAAVAAVSQGWPDEAQRRAAAALDVLWTAPSYQRLVGGWKLPADDAARVIEWMIGMVVAAIRAGEMPPVD